tara:strand:+ start:7404 stop:8573 length:1170 start_codon:yes stop_codon:yes gene_type:complete
MEAVYDEMPKQSKNQKRKARTKLKAIYGHKELISEKKAILDKMVEDFQNEKYKLPAGSEPTVVPVAPYVSKPGLGDAPPVIKQPYKVAAAHGNSVYDTAYNIHDFQHKLQTRLTLRLRKNNLNTSFTRFNEKYPPLPTLDNAPWHPAYGPPEPEGLLPPGLSSWGTDRQGKERGLDLPPSYPPLPEMSSPSVLPPPMREGRLPLFPKERLGPLEYQDRLEPEDWREEKREETSATEDAEREERRRAIASAKAAPASEAERRQTAMARPEEDLEARETTYQRTTSPLTIARANLKPADNVVFNPVKDTQLATQENQKATQDATKQLKQLNDTIRKHLQFLVDRDQNIANTYTALLGGMRGLMGQLNIPIHDKGDLQNFTMDRILAALVAK